LGHEHLIPQKLFETVISLSKVNINSSVINNGLIRENILHAISYGMREMKELQ